MPTLFLNPIRDTMEALVAVLGSEPIVLISMGGWVFGAVLACYCIKVLRDRSESERVLNDRLIDVISANTESITKMSVLLDERTKRGILP